MEWKGVLATAQNIVSMTITDEQRSALFAAVDQPEQQVTDKTIALDPDQRRELFKLGLKSETFCRQALAALDRTAKWSRPARAWTRRCWTCARWT